MSGLRPVRSQVTRQQLQQQSWHSLQDLASNLQAAVNNTLASGDNYESVDVLALHWENDEMGVVGLENELLELLRRDYNYNCEGFIIPTHNPHLALGQKLLNWTSPRARRNTLRIYIYSGHAASAGPADLSWVIGGRANANGALIGPQVNIKSLLYPCENLEGDSLYIFDCCSAGSVALWDGPEAIGACGWEQTSSASLDFCLTRAIIDTLKDNELAPITVASLFARLFRNAPQNQVGACPVHIPRRDHPSITLKPLSTSDSRPSRQSLYSERVLLSIKVRDNPNERDLQAWEAWLARDMPQDVLSVDIKVEASFKSRSTVLLMTVPLEVWTMIPEHPGYDFVSHVTSNNLLSATRALPHRPVQSKKENEPLSTRKSIR